MSGYQRVIVCGNVGKDPEIRSFPNGGKVCNFSVATSETWKDKATGEKKERVEWHRISVKGNDRLIDNVIVPYVKKGSTVLLEGTLQTRKWDKDGVDHYSTEIVIGAFNGSLTLMGSKKGGTEAPAAAHKGMDAQGDLAGTTASTLADMDDSIPF